MPLGRIAAWLLLLGPFWPAALAFFLKAQSLPEGALSSWFATSHPLWSSAILLFAYVNLLFVLGLVLANHSIFDFNWSMLPAAFFTPYFALHPTAPPLGARFWLIFVAVSLWSLRLTGNWLYKGGLGFEDFRYINYRKQMSPAVFFVFAYVALFLVQAGMIYAMCTPIYVALRAGTSVNLLDYLATLMVVGATLGELVADTQLHRFRARRDAGQTSQRFCTEGLWSWSRHPNYFFEICVWWGVYLFAVAATGQWLHWTILGPLTIHGLFLGGSVRLTEAHELARKPEYAEYQRTTSRLVPWPPRAPAASTRPSP